MPKIVCISDTHNHTFELPKGDYLIHAGDALGWGDHVEWFKFMCWMDNVRNDYKAIIYVPGNHDKIVEADVKLRQVEAAEAGFTLLVDSGIEIDDISFYGTPWVNYMSGRWAFEAYDDKQHRHFNGIRFDQDAKYRILLSHNPPLGYLDKGEYHSGSRALIKAVQRTKPHLHVFGHIHESYGIRDTPETVFVNAALMTRQYKPTNTPIVIDLEV